MATKAAERAMRERAEKFWQDSDQPSGAEEDLLTTFGLEIEAATIERCAQIADARAEWNRSACVRFAADDQKSMFDRASANAGEASRIAELVRSMGDAK